ncbi:MAG: hypothetical protein ACO1PI_12850 [Bacteroidota bacterium]
MSYTIHKVKLPKSQSFPAKTTEIEAVISKSLFGFERIISIEYLYTQHPQLLFEAFFYGLKIKEFAESNQGKITIRVYACSSENIVVAKQKLSNELDTNFVHWLNTLAENRFDWCNETRGFYVFL